MRSCSFLLLLSRRRSGAAAARTGRARRPAARPARRRSARRSRCCACRSAGMRGGGGRSPRPARGTRTTSSTTRAASPGVSPVEAATRSMSSGSTAPWCSHGAGQVPARIGQKIDLESQDGVVRPARDTFLCPSASPWNRPQRRRACATASSHTGQWAASPKPRGRAGVAPADVVKTLVVPARQTRTSSLCWCRETGRSRGRSYGPLLGVSRLSLPDASVGQVRHRLRAGRSPRSAPSRDVARHRRWPGQLAARSRSEQASTVSPSPPTADDIIKALDATVADVSDPDAEPRSSPGT